MRKKKIKKYNAFIALWLGEEMDRELSNMAKAQNEFKSALIRKAIKDYLEKNKTLNNI